MTLRERLRGELSRPVEPGLARLASVVSSCRPCALAVVHYGATLREGEFAGALIDFYLVVDSYRQAYRLRALALANRLVPPNVFPITQDGLSAKYAVLDRADLIALTGRAASTVSVWARLCQPLRLAWVKNDDARVLMTEAAARSVLTMLRAAAPLTEGSDPLALWRTGLRLTYGAELRAERGGRGDSVIEAERERYRDLALLGATELGWLVADGQIVPEWTAEDRAAERRLWSARRWRGKSVTLLRLAKASATYGGGIDYLACKIERHSGHPVRLRQWQRRWPLLGAVWLLPSLFRSGAIR